MLPSGRLNAFAEETDDLMASVVLFTDFYSYALATFCVIAITMFIWDRTDGWNLKWKVIGHETVLPHVLSITDIYLSHPTHHCNVISGEPFGAQFNVDFALGKTTQKIPRWLFLFSDDFLRFSPFEKADICVKKLWLLQKSFAYRNTSRKRASNSTSQRKVSAEDFIQHSSFFRFRLVNFFCFPVFSVVDSFLSFLRSTSEVHILHLSHISIGKDVAVALGNALSKHGELQVGHGRAQFSPLWIFLKIVFCFVLGTAYGRRVQGTTNRRSGPVLGGCSGVNEFPSDRSIDWLIDWLSIQQAGGRSIDWLIDFLLFQNAVLNELNLILVHINLIEQFHINWSWSKSFCRGLI